MFFSMPNVSPPTVKLVELDFLGSLVHCPVVYEIFLAIGGEQAVDAGVRYACSSGHSLSVHFNKKSSHESNYAQIRSYNGLFSVDLYLLVGHGFKPAGSYVDLSRAQLSDLAQARML